MKVKAGILVLVLFASACTSQTTTSTSTAETTINSESVTTTSSETVTTSSSEKVVSVHLFAEPVRFFALAPFHGANEVAMQLWNDHLVRINGEGEIIGSLAESWEVSDDGTVWTFNLRSGLTWQDGEPFTSADVKFSYDRYANPAAGSAHAGFFAEVLGAQDVADGAAESVAGFTTPDELTFVVELSSANVAWVTPFARNSFWILPEHILGDVPVDEFEDNPYWDNPTDGLGPYKFVQWLPDQYVEVERNEAYRSPVALDRLFLLQGAGDVATAQLGTGEIDIVIINPVDIEAVEAMDSASVVSAPDTGFVRLGFNLNKPRFQDERVRQAFHYAVDRQGIVDQILQGYGNVINNTIMTPWALPADLNAYPYDSELAQDLLEEAGFDFDVPVILIKSPGTARDQEEAALVVQAQLGQIGVTVEIQELEAAAWQEAMDPGLAEGGVPDFDLTMFAGGNYPPDPATIAAVTTCVNVFPNGFNIAYCRPDVDDKIADANQQVDQDLRAASYQEIARILNTDLPLLYLYQPDRIYGVSDRVEGFIPAGARSNMVWNAQDWDVSN